MCIIYRFRANQGFKYKFCTNVDNKTITDKYDTVSYELLWMQNAENRRQGATIMYAAANEK